MNSYKRLVGNELILKIRSFGELDSDKKIFKVMFACGYYHKDHLNNIIFDQKEFHKAYRSAKAKDQVTEINVEEKQYKSGDNFSRAKDQSAAKRKCAFYLMKDNRSGDVKIGISNNPKRRLKQVEAQYNVGSVSIIDKTWFLSKEEAHKYEKAFHNRYLNSVSFSWGGREWFNLNDEDISGFLEWMRRATEKRSYRARTISTKIWKTPDELEKDRTSAFWMGTIVSFLTGIIPAIGFLLTQSEIALFITPVGVGVYCLTKTKKDKKIQRTYGEDGFEISKGIPIWELNSMNLWDEEQLTIKDYKISKLSDMPNKIKPINLKN